MNLAGHTLNGLEQTYSDRIHHGLYSTRRHELLHKNPSCHLLERALPCELVLAHRRAMFHPWTCGYHRGATTVAVALKDDPRLHKECNWLLEETIGVGRSTTLDDRLRWTIDYVGRSTTWTIDHDHFIDALCVGSGSFNSSSTVLRV